MLGAIGVQKHIPPTIRIMQTNEDIVRRFYQAVDALYAFGEIKRVAHFERECGINHGTFYKLRITLRVIYCARLGWHTSLSITE